MDEKALKGDWLNWRMPLCSEVRGSAALSRSVLVAALALSGCGMPGNPQPPSLKLPQPVRDLAATRVGDEVHLHWTMPKRTTDRVTLGGDQDVHICRAAKGSACESAGDLRIAPGRPADFTDTLPAAETRGPFRLLTYLVELQNRAGRSAGASNPAWTAAGEAPAPVTGLRVNTTPRGVLLSWRAVVSQPMGVAVRIHRTQTSAPPRKNGMAGEAGDAKPLEQVLEAKGNAAQVLDRDAPFDQAYRYTVERVVNLNLGGHPVEVASLPSEPVRMDARDVFPPGVPANVVAVADAQGKAIDLSWTPDTDADLAGYAIYRAEGGKAPARISGSAPVPAPAYRDTNPVPGVPCIYFVSAIDRDGNESARSAPARETLPQ